MPHYQDWIASNFTRVLEYKCNDASGNLTDSGSSATDLTPNATPLYQNQASLDFEADGYSIRHDGSTDAFYKFNDNDWANGQTTGTIILIAPEFPGSGTFFGLSSSYSARSTGTSLACRVDGNKFAIECHSAGTEVLDMQVQASLIEKPALNAQIFVVVKESANQLPKIYWNGSLMNKDMVFDNANSAANFDNTIWVGDVYTAGSGNGSTFVGGFPTSVDSGSSLNALNEGTTGFAYEYIAYLDEALTGAQVETLFEKFYGGDNLGGALTRTGRNKQRRFWQDQVVGGVLPVGIQEFDEVLVFDGVSTNNYHWNFKVVGDTTLIDKANDDDWGRPIEDGIYSTLTSLTGYRLNISPDYRWMAWNKNGGGSTVGGAPLGHWDPKGRLWMDARWVWDDVHAGGPTPAGPGRFTSDNLFYINQCSSNSTPGSWYWDDEIRTWINQSPANTFNGTGPSRGLVSFGTMTMDINSNDRIAMATNTVFPSASGFHIGDYNSGTKQIDMHTLDGGTAVYQSAYSAAVMSNRDVAFFGKNSVTAAPATTNASSQIYAYSKTGATQWTLDATMWNNGSAIAAQTGDSTTVNCFLEVGDDLYVGVTRSLGSEYKNLWHLRWNGSYYADQGAPDFLGDGVYRRNVHGITVSPDGTFVMVMCSNGGSGSGHPCILAYSRNTSTGALTPLDDGVGGSYVFAASGSGGYVIDDSNTNYTSQNPDEAWPIPRASRPTTGMLSPFELSVAGGDGTSGATLLYHFRQASGDLKAAGYKIDAQRSSWDMTVEGSGHTFEATGGDSSQDDATELKAITLNGSGGWLRGTPGNIMDSDTSGTFIVAGKFTAATNSYIWWFSNAADTGAGEIGIGVNGSNQVYCEVFDAAGSSDGVVTDGGGYNDGEWHIWVFTKSGTNLKCWVDGLLQNTTVMTTGYWFSTMVPGTNCDNIGIGGLPNAGGSALTSRFTGTLDHLAYCSVLADDQIRSLSFTYKYW